MKQAVSYWQSLSYRISSWNLIVIKFAHAETGSYLRNKSAIFWTFVYPVVLLVLMISLFGERSLQMTVDIQGQGRITDLLASALERRSQATNGLEIVTRRVSPDDSSPEHRVRLIVGEGHDVSGSTTVRVQLDTPPDSASGAMLALSGEAISSLNLTLSGHPPLVRTEYMIRDRHTGDTMAPGTHAYYVTGLAVLTLVSTALFGFSAPLVDLRSRGCLRILQIMPVPRSAFLAGFALCRIGILFAFIVSYLVIGLTLLSDSDLGADALCMLGTLVILGSTAFISAGLALAGIITHPGIASAVVNLLNLPLMFLSDLFIPVETLPQMLQDFAQFSPVYMLANSMRAAALGQATWPDLVPCVSSLLALGLVSVLLAAHTFRWTAKQ